MLTMKQVVDRLRRGHILYGRLLTSPDGSEWIRVTLTRSVLHYYQTRVQCYGFFDE